MKKFCFFVLSVVIMSMLVGCDNGLSKQQKLVSEYRDDYLVGSSESFSAEAVTGYRESPFAIDGISSENKTDFFLLTLTPKIYDPTREYGYCVNIGGKTYEGSFNKHPFENTYSFELNVRLSGGAVAVTVDGEEISLTSIKTEQFITPDKAFEIAIDRLGDTATVKSGEYEIYVRLIANPISASGGYFWYVAFVDVDGETVAVLIQPETLEIVAVRE